MVLKIPRKDNIKMEILVYQIPVKVHSLFISNCRVCQVNLPRSSPKCNTIALHEFSQTNPLVNETRYPVSRLHS